MAPNEEMKQTTQESRKRNPVHWELTEEDKEFLRACNIRPE